MKNDKEYSEIFENYTHLKDDAKFKFPKSNRFKTYKRKPFQIPKTAEQKRKELENDDLEQDIKLRRKTLTILFGFLGIETFLVFLFSFFQAIHWPLDFELEEWSFKLLFTVTIVQITFMTRIAVEHLFPHKNGK
jgi:hypothetical protein